ncbi:MAG: sensor histidine kinase [Acidimicrobiales bacterium]
MRAISAQAEVGPAWPEAKRWMVDGAVAVAVGAAQVGLAFAQVAHQGGVVTSGEVALLGAGGLVLAARRRWPVAVMVAAYGLTLLFQATQHFDARGGAGWLAVIVAFATAIYLRRRVAALVFLVVCYVVSLWGPAAIGEGHAPSAVFALSLGTGLVALLGGTELVRLQRQRSAALAQGQREEALRQASEERLRIARDLHDIVAHNISVINVQANTALHLMDRQAERARAALTTIHEVSKQALVELRSVLGVLRDVDQEAPRAPAPGLAQLGALLESSRAAGLAVQVIEEGERRRLPADVDITAYRIVQESLTNISRHSGGGRATVCLSYGESDLVVEVDDDGPSVGAGRTNGAGKGITGMSERAQAVGGTLQVGPRPGGGFSVQTCLPLNGHSR